MKRIETLVWSTSEQCHITTEQTYENVNINITEPVIIDEGAVLNLKNVVCQAVGIRFKRDYAFTINGILKAEEVKFCATGYEGRTGRSLSEEVPQEIPTTKCGRSGKDFGELPRFSFNPGKDAKVFLNRCTLDGGVGVPIWTGGVPYAAWLNPSTSGVVFEAEECYFHGRIWAYPKEWHFKKCVFSLPYNLQSACFGGHIIRNTGTILEDCTMFAWTEAPFTGATFINCNLVWNGGFTSMLPSVKSSKVVNCWLRNMCIYVTRNNFEGIVEFARPGSRIGKMGIDHIDSSHGRKIPYDPAKPPTGIGSDKAAKVKGYFSVEEVVFLEPKEEKELIRAFPIYCLDGNNKPIAEKKVQIVDKEGRTADEGITDKDGFVELEAWFNHANYTDGNYFVSIDGERQRTVSLLTDSYDGVQIECKQKGKEC